MGQAIDAQNNISEVGIFGVFFIFCVMSKMIQLIIAYLVHRKTRKATWKFKNPEDTSLQWGNQYQNY